MTALQGRALLEAIGSNLDAIEDETEALADAADLETLARFAHELATISKLLAEQARHASKTLAETMPEKRMELAGMIVERRQAADRKAWDWDLLLPTLTRLHVDPDGTGEIPDAATLIVSLQAMVRDVIGVTPSRGPRIGALRGLGLDPDEWCEVSPGRVSVQITGTPDDEGESDA